MRSVRLALLLPVVLLASCADSGQVTAPAGTHKPNFNPGATPPDTSGPNVTRRFPGAAFIWDGSLAVIVGNDATIEQVCADVGNFLAPGASQLVLTPPGGFHGIFTSHEVTIRVFEFAGDLTSPCELVEAPLVATGTGTVKFESNGGPGAFLNHITVEGILDLASGGQASLLVRSQFVVRPGGSVLDHTTITLTPL